MNDEDIEILTDEYDNVKEVSLEYNEYRNELNKIYGITNDDNSIISVFSVLDNTCNHSLMIKYSSGAISNEKDKDFEYNEDFKDSFLIPMVEDYVKYNEVLNDRVEINDDKVTLIINNTHNDTLIIKNIDEELSTKLSDIIKTNNMDNINIINSKEIKRGLHEQGVGNTLVIALVLVLMFIIIAGIVFFTVMNNK